MSWDWCAARELLVPGEGLDPVGGLREGPAGLAEFFRLL